MEKNKNFKFNYSGNDIEFSLRGDGKGSMINATEMAKPFGKTTKDWLRTGPAKEFIEAVSSVRHICLTELVVKVQGGDSKKQGTWMHEDVAIEFARWLNPVFAVWCNDKVKEILVNGYSVIDSSKESFERACSDIQGKLSAAEGEIIRLNNILSTQAPMISFLNATMNNNVTTFSTTDIVKGLNFKVGVQEFYDLLEKNKIIFYKGKRWYLKCPYDKSGFTKDVTIDTKRVDPVSGNPIYRTTTRWTDQGRAFLYAYAISWKVVDPIYLP